MCKEYFDKYILNLLEKYGVDIFSGSYKKTSGYKAIKNDTIFGGEYGSLTLEQYIEKHLLTNEDLLDFEDAYTMGNSVELEESEYSDFEVAKKVIKDFRLKGRFEGDPLDPSDYKERFYRKKHGIFSRLKEHLAFDIDSFDKNNERYMRERAKIIYLVYALEYKYFPKIKVLELLSKPSVENIDSSGVGMKTYNGFVIKRVKNLLEKELLLHDEGSDFLMYAKKGMDNIIRMWDWLLEASLLILGLPEELGFERKIEEKIEEISTLIHDPAELIISEESPVEALYLKVAQLEQLGQIMDISKINNLQERTELERVIPPEFIAEFKKMDFILIDIAKIELYVSNNATRIAKYVFLKANPSKNEIDKVRYHKSKIARCYSFAERTRPSLLNNGAITELMIVSILQVILLSGSEDSVNIAFPNYQSYLKHMPKPQAILKDSWDASGSNARQIPDLLKFYWIEKSVGYWYSNVGRGNAIKIFRRLENKVDKILIQALACNSLHEMVSLHNYYFDKIYPFIFEE